MENFFFLFVVLLIHDFKNIKKKKVGCGRWTFFIRLTKLFLNQISTKAKTLSVLDVFTRKQRQGI